MKKGSKMSLESRKKMSIAKKLIPTRYWLGRTFSHSTDTKSKMSANRKGRKNSFFGKKHTEETKNKISQSKKGQSHPQTLETRKRISETRKKKFRELGYLNSPETRRKISEWNILHPTRPSSNTKIEVKMKELLDALGVEYIFQFSVEKVARVDFYIPSKKLVIFCDGCYWHGCPVHFPHRIRKVDTEQNIKLEELGYKVLRFWEHDIHKMSVIKI